MTNGQAAKRMADILGNSDLSDWDCWLKIQQLIRDFEGRVDSE